SNKIYAISSSGLQVGYYLPDGINKRGPYNITGASTLSPADLDGDGYLDDIIGVGSGTFFALAHKTLAPAPEATTPPVTTSPPPLKLKNVSVEAGEDRTVTKNTLVTLTPETTASLDNGSIVSYLWTEGSTILGQEKSLSKIFEEGEHEIKVIITDNTGAKASDTIIVIVAAQSSPTPPPTTTAPEPEGNQTSPIMMVLLGIIIGAVVVGAIMYFSKKKESEEEWTK
ncbi:MAG: PKD domain-containing protein, partial [Candidatus Hydrothermarchaeaceae archaeon]